jgi:hypothetical protein
MGPAAAPYNLHLRDLLLLGYALWGGGLYLFEKTRSEHSTRHAPSVKKKHGGQPKKNGRGSGGLKLIDPNPR